MSKTLPYREAVRPQRPTSPPPATEWLLGVDLGKLSDPAALAVIKRVGTTPPQYQVLYLQRWPLHTRYRDVVDRVVEVWQSAQLDGGGRRWLVADKTGVGEPVIEQFEDRGIPTVGITIMASGTELVRTPKTPTLMRRPGEKLHVVFYDYHVPKRDLVTATRIVLEGGRLKVAGDLRERDTLQQELQNFSRKTSETGRDQYEALKAGEHDDLALSVILPLWFGERELPVALTGQSTARLKVRASGGV